MASSLRGFYPSNIHDFHAPWLLVSYSSALNPSSDDDDKLKAKKEKVLPC